MIEAAGHELLARIKELDQRLSNANRQFLDDKTLAMAELDTASDAVVVIDTLGKIVLINKRCEVVFRCLMSDMIDKDVSIIIPPEYRGALCAKMETYFDNPVPRTFMELEALRCDGTKIPVSISIFPVTSSSGILVMAVIREREMPDGT